MYCVRGVETVHGSIDSEVGKMNIPELIEIIDTYYKRDMLMYEVDMVEYEYAIDTSDKPARAYTRFFNHQVKYFNSADEVITFLFDCDISLWDLDCWNLPTSRAEYFMDSTP